MDWYLMVWRKYAEFDGRSRRTEFWMFELFNFMAAFVLIALGCVGLAISEDYGGILFVPLVIYILAIIIPGLAVRVRRLHDTGLSGWLLLIGLIPYLGGLILIILMCLDSNPGTNQYGPNPKSQGQAWMASGNAGYTSMGPGGQPQPFTGENNLGFCKNCGRPFKDETPFCSGCGVRR